VTRLILATVMLAAGDKDDLAPATGIVVAALMMLAAIAIGYAAWCYLTA